ncbi:porin family protein [Psychroflexus montanilacus]|uniref:porin family protein n=1 Tax=Psychroflexus montanilacus TaxID=2873598 RepID=UPI001CCA6AFE|nr:porin family protein [Psychroflexus montanilacus]MBZ9652454.1 PorT family protein [Psychroflexus montanilacus]
MKSLLLSTALIFISLQFLYSQENKESLFSYGLKAGVSDYSFSSDKVSSTSNFSFYAGGFAYYKLSNTSNIQAELLFESYGIKDESFFSTDTNLVQLSLPVFMKFEAKPNLFFNLGGFVGYHLDVNTKSNGRSTMDFIKDWNAGLLAGIEYHIYKGFSLEARYNYGLIDLQNGPEFSFDIITDLDEIKTRGLFFGINFQF